MGLELTTIGFAVLRLTDCVYRVTPDLDIMLKPRSHCPGIRPGASRQFVVGEPGYEFDFVHTFPATLRTRPGLGQ